LPARSNPGKLGEQSAKPGRAVIDSTTLPALLKM